MEYDDFRPSITALYRQGGPFKNAAEKVFAIRQKAFSGFEHKDVFAIATTHNGESRIPHCVKYELPGRARLVTMVNNGICMFLYAGDHTEVDLWLDRNRSIDFILKRQGNAQVIEPVFVSQSTNRQDLIKTESDLGAPDHLLDLISGRYGDKLLDGLPEETARVIASVGPLITDDELLQIVESIKDQGRRSAVLDVLLKLSVLAAVHRAGNVMADSIQCRFKLWRKGRENPSPAAMCSSFDFLSFHDCLHE